MNEIRNLSIITPVYSGMKYVNNINKSFESLEQLSKKMKINFEWIIVDDNPIELTTGFSNGITKVNNDCNLGIHGSRSVGLGYASGKNVLFLDQDDKINEKELLLALNEMEIQKADVLVCNGFFELPNGECRKVFPNSKYQKAALHEENYLDIKDLIVSPGQCLIKHDAIPIEWLNNHLKENGVDDYLLWILMFNGGCIFKASSCCYYTHAFSGSNLSFNTENWRKSINELLGVLVQMVSFPTSKLNRLKVSNELRMIMLTPSFSNYLRAAFLQPKTFLKMLIFRLYCGRTVISTNEMDG